MLYFLILSRIQEIIQINVHQFFCIFRNESMNQNDVTKEKNKISIQSNGNHDKYPLKNSGSQNSFSLYSGDNYRQTKNTSSRMHVETPQWSWSQWNKEQIRFAFSKFTLTH